MAGKIKIKRGTTAQWADSSTNDITLAPGQPGVEYCEDGKTKLKIGPHTEDGSNTEWDKIDYISAEGAEMIKTSTTGKNYIISDCAEETIVSLTAYGESVQDGTPAPDSPVEIVSVENPVINVGGQTVIIPYTFRGLKNSSGGWVARDELRVGNGKVEIVRNVDYLDCTSDLNWRKSGSTVCDIYYFVYFDTAVEGLQPTLCTHFKGIPSVSLGNSYLLDKGVWFAYAPHNTTTVEDWKSFLDTANMSVIFASETSTVEDITDTEAGQALLALKTNYPSTSVISDIDCNIEYLTVDSIVDQKYNPNSVYPQSGRAVAEAIQAAETDKQDKFGDVEASGEQLEINNINATRCIQFRSVNLDMLNVKTDTPTEKFDCTNKQYVDDSINNATRLNWKDAVLKFYERISSTEVANLNIKYAEDTNFVYIYLAGSISDCKVLYAEADLDITPITTPSYSSPITYFVNDMMLSTPSFTTNSNIVNTKYNISIGNNNALDLTNKSMRIYGTYLFKK